MSANKPLTLLSQTSEPPTHTLGQFIGVPDNFHLNFIYRLLGVFTNLKYAVNFFFNGIMYSMNAVYLVKKLFRGGSFNFILCTWSHLFSIEKIQCASPTQ